MRTALRFLLLFYILSLISAMSVIDPLVHYPVNSEFLILNPEFF